MAPIFEQVDTKDLDWTELDSYKDRNIHQSGAWLKFMSSFLGSDPIIARLSEGNSTLGYFTGFIVKKFGLKILGSPFPGWNTTYMGFNLKPEVPRVVALRALEKWAFTDLGCHHLEVLDRYVTVEDLQELGFHYRIFHGYEIDLTPDVDKLWSNLRRDCRGSIRKSIKNKVTVEQSHDLEFADDYYLQLEDVFAKNNLTPPYPKERVKLLIENLAPSGMLLLLRARDENGTCIATGILPAMASTMYSWGAASYRDYQKLRPNEPIHWSAMKYWKDRGITVCDMVGGGDYKKKYGGYEIAVPWARKSRNSALTMMRSMARPAFDTMQLIRGTLKSAFRKSGV